MGPILKAKSASMTRTSPMASAASSSRTRAIWGWHRYMNASMKKTSSARTTSSTRSSSRAFMVTGFSQRMCFPARAARIDSSAWVSFIVEM